MIIVWCHSFSLWAKTSSTEHHHIWINSLKPCFHSQSSFYVSKCFWHYFIPTIPQKKNKRNMTRKGSETHLRDSCKWRSSGHLPENTAMLAIPCKPDMAVTTGTGGGWEYELARMEYFKVTMGTPEVKLKTNKQIKIEKSSPPHMQSHRRDNDSFFLDSFWKLASPKKRQCSSPGSPNRPLVATGLRRERWETHQY